VAFINVQQEYLQVPQTLIP